MKKFVVLIIVIAAGIYLFPKVSKKVTGESYEGKAKVRVQTMMDAWKKAGTAPTIDGQTAMCQWDRGASFISDQVEFGRASDGYDKWRQSRELYRGIQGYEIAEVKVDEGKTPEVAHVSISIDGKKYGMRVPDRSPIQWE